MMIFNSIVFVEFYLCILLLVCLLRRFTIQIKMENLLLLVASYYFYGSFKLSFLVCLLYITIVNYGCGLLLEKKNRKTVIGICVFLSLLPLATFKYADFLFVEIFGVVKGSMLDGWVAPLGVSFFTFQALSYSIDVYRNKTSMCRNFLDFSLFVSFFPTLLSGPIERSRNLLPQITTNRSFSWQSFYSAVCIFSYGLFKKVVIADRVNTYVDSIYASPDTRTSVTLIFAAILYSIQIYCDFSGYSDMAMGVARGLGFNITQNFRFPYFSTSIKDFWHRWHISLTSWFTEYVYFSLGGNRVKHKSRWVFNISMIFLLSGIWHGAAWGFIVWGMLHAVLYLTEYFLGIQSKNFEPSVAFRMIYRLLVFIVVTVAWIFFCTESLDLAWQIISGIFTNGGLKLATGASTMTFACNMMLLLLFVFAELFLCYKKKLLMKEYVREFALVAVWLLLALFAVSSDSFVYFQF